MSSNPYELRFNVAQLAYQSLLSESDMKQREIDSKIHLLRTMNDMQHAPGNNEFIQQLQSELKAASSVNTITDEALMNRTNKIYNFVSSSSVKPK
jgi:hypothetical protein